jgi:hypothetical protein
MAYVPSDSDHDVIQALSDGDYYDCPTAEEDSCSEEEEWNHDEGIPTLTDALSPKPKQSVPDYEKGSGNEVSWKGWKIGKRSMIWSHGDVRYVDGFPHWGCAYCKSDGTSWVPLE